MERTARKNPTRRGPLIALLAALIGSSGCTPSTEPDTPPATARIVVEGTAPAPLRLVISTDFIETYDQVNDLYGQTLFDSDTLAIVLPFEQSVDLLENGGDGSIFVELANLEMEPATVTMKVYVDGKIKYDQGATLSDEGALRFVFTNQSPIL